MAINITGLGNANGIGFKSKVSGGGSGYLPPELKDSIVGLWKFDQNTNESPTCNIIKNTIKGKGGDLELLNFAYKANSGYNGYPEDFTSWGPFNAEVSKGGDKAKNTKVDFNLLYTYSDIKRDVGPFKAKISNFTKGIIRYWYRQEDGTETILLFEPITVNNSNGLIELPKSYNTVENGTGFRGGFTGNDTNIGVTIEQLPLYEGALVTDGKDDMIVSQKTVQEMLGGSNKITVVSMIHQIELNSGGTFTNYIRESSTNNLIRNKVLNAGKTGIYGYKCSNLNTQTTNTTIINEILGDKKDYDINVLGTFPFTEKFSVIGYGNSLELSEVAIYWAFISNKVLTTDEINQIIGYFKLDKYVTPQVIYDVKRQGLTNDTPDSDWYLKDFSGNGHDMQLYNYAKKGNSGIGKYEADYSTWIKTEGVTSTSFGFKIIEPTHNYWLLYTSNVTIPAHKVLISGIPEGGELRYLGVNILINGINKLPKMAEHPSAIGFTLNRGTTQPGDWVGLSVEQIPDYEGALVSDGKDDYGHADNLPIFKDYTVAIDKAWINLVGAKSQCLSTKNSDPDWGAFNFELSEGISRNTFSFGNTNQISIDVDRKISYQSKYSYNGATIAAGNIVDGKDLFLFRSRSAYPYYAEAAIWSYLLFPYSLSEFLLERQLKKYKLGTLYPNMVEVRPIVKSNTDNYMRIEYRNGKGGLIQPGSYLPVGSILRISVVLNDTLDEVSSLKVNGVDIPKSNYSGGRFWIYDATVTKSPQKIDITIDEYIRFEDIVQPYPEIWTITQNGNRVSWGDKLKVGGEFIIQSKTPLLPELYTSTNFYYNGNVVNHSTPYIVEKRMTFACDKTWKLNTTEPHAIYSPQKLNIPNSSLKILGYVPDLTGKGNRGKLNNFAYAGMSGANGYVEDFTKWGITKSNIVSTISDSSIHFTHIGVNYGYTTAIFETKATSNNKYNIKVRISGLTSNMRCFFNNTDEHSLQELVNGVNEISVDLIVGWYGFNINTLDGSVIGDCDITIQQIGEHEGSICFDGTNDHITIPTLAHGGKCVMMKVNWSSLNTILYDQRVLSPTLNNFSIYTSDDNDVVAYNARNSGSTYIDSVLNANIITSQLVNITHNIAITNSDVTDVATVSPIIGCSTGKGLFAKMTMYEFMLFPEIPSEDEIKKLNDIMGIENNIEVS